MSVLQRGRALETAAAGILALCLGVLAVFLVPLSFVHGPALQQGLANILRIRINPAFAGGPELARFRDAVGDDRGAGSLEYPLSAPFADNHGLDLARYVVHQPQVGVPWSTPEDFWQLDCTMADLVRADSAAGFAGPVIRIYVGLGLPGGSAETAESRAELVAFDPAHPWNFVVTIDGSHRQARLRWADGKTETPVPLYANFRTRTLTVRLPLDDPRLSRVLDGRATWHYVLVGAHDALAMGGFMPVRERPGLSAGGGAESRLTPRIFDCLLPRGRSQSALLAGFDEEAGRPAALEAVEVAAWAAVPAWWRGGQVAGSVSVDPGRLAGLETQAAADAAASRQGLAALVAEAARASPASPDGMDSLPAGPAATQALELAAAEFRLGRLEEAGRHLKAILDAEPANAKARAWLGAVIASQGGQAGSTAESVRLVNLAYESLDAAVAGARVGDQPDAWITRGSVSLAVPDSVFHRSRQAAEDFGAAAGFLEKAVNSPDAPAGLDGLRELLADCCLKAGIGLEQAGSPDEAELWFQRSMAQKPRAAATLLELARRDFLEE